MHGYFLGATPTQGIEHIQTAMQRHAAQLSPQLFSQVSQYVEGANVYRPAAKPQAGMDLQKVLPIAVGAIAALMLLK